MFASSNKVQLWHQKGLGPTCECDIGWCVEAEDHLCGGRISGTCFLGLLWWPEARDFSSTDHSFPLLSNEGSSDIPVPWQPWHFWNKCPGQGQLWYWTFRTEWDWNPGIILLRWDECTTHGHPWTQYLRLRPLRRPQEPPGELWDNGVEKEAEQKSEGSFGGAGRGCLRLRLQAWWAF